MSQGSEISRFALSVGTNAQYEKIHDQRSVRWASRGRSLHDYDVVSSRLTSHRGESDRREACAWPVLILESASGRRDQETAGDCTGLDQTGRDWTLAILGPRLPLRLQNAEPAKPRHTN